MLIMFTDFGVAGPYLGQMRVALAQAAPMVPVVALVSDAPAFRPKSAARLLAALVNRLPAGSVVIAVVDPGVGSGRLALVLRADGRYFVGPDNGLLDGVAAGATECAWFEITWRPDSLSNSFHGRDLFAPVAGALAIDPARLAEFARELTPPPLAWEPDLAEVIYVDGYGNLITGLQAANFDEATVFRIGGQSIHHGKTFSAVVEGGLLWYRNSMNLVEVAENCGSAAHRLGAKIGDGVMRLGPGMA